MRTTTRIIVACLALAVAGTAFAASTFDTDKRTYDVGEHILFTLHNESDEPMIWASISYYPIVWRLIGDGQEEIMRDMPLISLQAVGVLLPGDDHTWEWDQIDYHQWYDGGPGPDDLPKQVPHGRYVARFETMERGQFETPLFVIGTLTSVEPRAKLTTSWAHLKTSRD